MKLVIIMGPQAVGKMTVGQELAAITGLKLLHNHMTIELVNNFFDVFDSDEGRRLNALFRREIIEAVANSDLPGLIYTCVFEYDTPARYEYIRSIIDLFASRGAATCIVELCADYAVRLERNRTENRLLHKPSKRDVEKSEEIFRSLETKHRFISRDGETPFDDYLKLDNTDLSPQEAAAKIKQFFAL